MDTQSFVIDSCQSLESHLATLRLAKGTNVLIQLFSDAERELVHACAKILKRAFPRSQLIGMSGEQMIQQGDILLHQTLIVISSFDSVELTSTVVPYNDDPGTASTKMIDSLAVNKTTKLAICFADRLEFSVRYDLALFSNIPKPMVLSGGVSCTTKYGQWVLLETEFYEHAFVAVALHSPELNVEVGGFTEFYPLGKTFVVTKAQGRIVEMIDGQSVRSIYNRYLGDGYDVPFELIQNFPFVITEGFEQDTYAPVQELEDGAILFNKPIPEGAQIRFCYDHPSLTLEQVHMRSKELLNHAPHAIFIYNCTSRLNFMEGNVELKPLQHVANTFGVYCMGEICFFNQKQQILHHSMTFVSLREGSEHLSTVDSNAITHSKYLGAVSPLFSLIRNSLLDLDERNNSMERQIRQQAEMLTRSYRIDRRTGLPNRSALRQRLSKFELSEHLLNVKLTNFNQINEKYGYLVGDKLLLDLTEYFSAYIENKSYKSCELYSVGIGEWAVVFKTEMSEFQIHQYFSRFTDKLENVNFEPFGLPDIEFLSVSVNGGLVSRRDFEDEPIDGVLLKSVEARRHAYHQNKRFCNASQLIERDQKRTEQLSWLSYVSRAIISDNVIPFVQPIFRARTHELASYECLVRIQDNNDIISPGRFLPIVEGTHLYTRLSRQMISKTFEIMQHRTESFSINLAPQDFMSDRTLDQLEQSIQRIEKPSRVGIEVLETEQIKDYTHMINVCSRLRKLGARIIIDDFGCGYSNIDEIIKLEPQVIKLDGSLIRNIDTDLKQRHITQQLIQLCQVLNAQTVAEFVHNQQVCQIVEDMGIDFLQGYYLGEPKRLD